MYNNSLYAINSPTLKTIQSNSNNRYSRNAYSFLSIISDNLHVPSRIHSNGHTEGAS